MTDLATRMGNLRHANRVRVARAMSKKEMTAHGAAYALRLLEDLPWYWESATMEQFVTAIPGIGEVRRKKILARTILNSNKRLGDLQRQSRVRFAREISVVL
jgi:hypothetical protein